MKESVVTILPTPASLNNLTRLYPFKECHEETESLYQMLRMERLCHESQID